MLVVLAPVQRHHHQPFAMAAPRNFVVHRVGERKPQQVDNAVAHQLDIGFSDAFATQMLCRVGSGGQVPLRQLRNTATERLFRKRSHRVVRAQTGFKMGKRNAAINRCQRAGIGGGSIALHQRYIGLLVLQPIAGVLPQVGNSSR